MAKIFGIGLSRTGTQSLTRALQILGFKARHMPFSLQDILDNDAVTDTSVSVGFEFLDAMFPDSKFIYTVRDCDEWEASMIAYFDGKTFDHGAIPKIHRSLYPGGLESSVDLVEAFYRHSGRVEDYFYERANDLLWLDICAGDGWEPLCKFLDRPIPAEPFPHLNKRPTF